MLRKKPSSSTPHSGEFHFTALRTSGTAATTISSIRRPTSLFHSGIAAMYSCTGPSPSPFGIWGFPPESSFGFFATAGRLTAGERCDEPLPQRRVAVAPLELPLLAVGVALAGMVGAGSAGQRQVGGPVPRGAGEGRVDGRRP